MRTLATLAFILFSAAALMAQSEEDAYLKIDYITVNPSDNGNFLHQAQSLWRNQMQNRVDKGELIRWQLYRVAYRGNKDYRYNYVSVQVAPSLNDLETRDQPAIVRRRQILDAPVPLDITHSELWRTQSTAHREPGVEPSRYMNANFMRVAPHRTDDYLELEREIARPLHRLEMEDDRMDGWEFYRLIFPGGSIYEYNYMTADFYRRLEQIEFGITSEMIAREFPEIEEGFDDYADAIRERVWSDLWELVEFVME